YFSVLDLKDAFFCVPVEEQSQTIFAFEWENPTTGRKVQLCWTVLPQGFKSSPALFGNVLAKDLEQWQHSNNNGTLSQYIDTLLIGADAEKNSSEVTVSLRNYLGPAGYKVSQKEAQVAKEKVQYLGFEISKGQRELGLERKEAICRIAVPKTKRQLRGLFLGIVGFCRIWMPNFGLATKLLYGAMKGPRELLERTPDCRKSFNQIKKKLKEAPGLGFRHMTKPF
ncbi:hypothetical protein N335_09699, partial [Phaethon lepturus]